MQYRKAFKLECNHRELSWGWGPGPDETSHGILIKTCVSDKI